MGDDSTPRNVLSLGSGNDNMYKILSNNGEFYTVNSEHILCLKIYNANKIYRVDKNIFRVQYYDKQINKLKGKDRPINNYKDRIDLFKTISFVDYIILYNEENIEKEETLGNIMKIVNPFYWSKGDDYNEKKIIEKHPYLRNIKLIKNIDGKSTTNIINKIKMDNIT